MSLVTLPADECPDCGSELFGLTWAEDALVRHAGYGETRRTTVTKCGECGLEVRRDITSERPGN